MLGWICKRERLCVEMERPKLGLEQVHVSQAVHPTKVLASAEESWMRLWGRQGSTGKVESLLAAHPQLRQFRWEPVITVAELLQVGKGTAGKAAADGLRLPGACFCFLSGKRWLSCGRR